MEAGASHVCVRRKETKLLAIRFTYVKSVDVAMHREVNDNNRSRVRLRGTHLWLYNLSSYREIVVLGYVFCWLLPVPLHVPAYQLLIILSSPHYLS